MVLVLSIRNLALYGPAVLINSLRFSSGKEGIYSARPKSAVFARLDQTAVPATIASTHANLTTRYDPVKHQIRKFPD